MQIRSNSPIARRTVNHFVRHGHRINSTALPPPVIGRKNDVISVKSESGELPECCNSTSTNAPNTSDLSFWISKSEAEYRQMIQEEESDQ